VSTQFTLAAIFAKIELEGMDFNPATDVLWVRCFCVLKIGDASGCAGRQYSVVLVAVFAVTFLNEQPSFWEWIGIFLVGLVVVILAVRK